MKKNNYNVIWQRAGQPSIANVSLTASTDHNAKQQANKIARELGVTNTPRTITAWKDGKYVTIESINTGVSD